MADGILLLEYWLTVDQARDLMLKATNSKVAPWTLVDCNDKRAGRLTLICHLLDQIPDRKVAETLVYLHVSTGH